MVNRFLFWPTGSTRVTALLASGMLYCVLVLRIETSRWHQDLYNEQEKTSKAGCNQAVRKLLSYSEVLLTFSLWKNRIPRNTSVLWQESVVYSKASNAFHSVSEPWELQESPSHKEAYCANRLDSELDPLSPVKSDRLQGENHWWAPPYISHCEQPERSLNKTFFPSAPWNQKSKSFWARLHNALESQSKAGLRLGHSVWERKNWRVISDLLIICHTR